jgi:hypothetical protein
VYVLENFSVFLLTFLDVVGWVEAGAEMTLWEAGTACFLEPKNKNKSNFNQKTILLIIDSISQIILF